MHKFILHLNAEGCPRLKSLPVGISKLISLQTLKGICVSIGKKAANANALQLRHLKDLNLLQHLSLQVIDDDHDATLPESVIQLEENIFQDMTKMRTLEFFNHGSCLFDLPKDMAVMERLEIVHLYRCVLPKWIFQLKNLRELKSSTDQSSDYKGLERIPNLTMLDLAINEKCVEFPKEFGKAGAFPKLQKFSIKSFNGLKIFPPLDDHAMPNLKYLRIEGCEGLECRPERFQRLENIEEEQDLEQCDLPSQLDLHDEGSIYHIGVLSCLHCCPIVVGIRILHILVYLYLV